MKTQGSFGTAVGVILVDMQDLLARARDSTLSKEAASVRQALGHVKQQSMKRHTEQARTAGCLFQRSGHRSWFHQESPWWVGCRFCSWARGACCNAEFRSFWLTKQIFGVGFSLLELDSLLLDFFFSQPRPLRVFDIFRKRLLGRLTASLSVPTQGA